MLQVLAAVSCSMHLAVPACLQPLKHTRGAKVTVSVAFDKHLCEIKLEERFCSRPLPE